MFFPGDRSLWSFVHLLRVLSLLPVSSLQLHRAAQEHWPSGKSHLVCHIKTFFNVTMWEEKTNPYLPVQTWSPIRQNNIVECEWHMYSRLVTKRQFCCSLNFLLLWATFSGSDLSIRKTRVPWRMLLKLVWETEQCKEPGWYWEQKLWSLRKLLLSIYFTCEVPNVNFVLLKYLPTFKWKIWPPLRHSWGHTLTGRSEDK